MNPSWSLEEEARKAGQKGWALLEPALVSRAVLAINHVLLSEVQAVQRLRAHAGCPLRVRWRPGTRWLPTPPDIDLMITAAGLLEPFQDGDGKGTGREFTLEVSMDDALAALSRSQPLTQAVKLDGDAALATDLAWMLEHLRWDVEADLAQVLPPAVAHGVARAGRTAWGLLQELAGPLRRRAQAFGGHTPDAEPPTSAGR